MAHLKTNKMQLVWMGSEAISFKNFLSRLTLLWNSSLWLAKSCHMTKLLHWIIILYFRVAKLLNSKSIKRERILWSLLIFCFLLWASGLGQNKAMVKNPTSLKNFANFQAVRNSAQRGRRPERHWQHVGRPHGRAGRDAAHGGEAIIKLIISSNTDE